MDNFEFWNNFGIFGVRGKREGGTWVRRKGGRGKSGMENGGMKKVGKGERGKGDGGRRKVGKEKE